MTTYSAALEAIHAALGLPPGDGFTQDWVHELPEAFRSAEWMNRCLALVLRWDERPGERAILVSLVLDIANDLAGVGQLTSDDWERISRALHQHRPDYADLLAYWSLEGEPLEDCFAITPLVREAAKAR